MKKPNITIDDFAKLDIRVGCILDAKPVPNSKKLIQLSVDLGPEYGVVSILAGLQPFYPDLSVFVNRKYLFLANLTPRAMAGMSSNGMFLAIDAATQVTPIEISSDVPTGASVR